MSAEREALPRDETEATEQEKKVLKQCEFYFSDSNLPRDKFLRRTVKEGKGWVELKVLATFNKLKTLLPEHTTDEARADALSKILRKSKSLLVVSEDKYVKRAVPIDPQEAKKVSLARSVAVEGLPTDKSQTSIDSVTKFFASQGATVHYVKLLHKFDKEAPKGSQRELNGGAFVELGDEKEAESYIAKELKWEGTDAPLKLEKLSAYLEARKKEKGEKEGSKKRKGSSNGDAGDKEDPAEEDPKGLQLIEKDRLIMLTGLGEEGEGEGEENEVSREVIKAFIEEKGKCEVAFINFDRGDKFAVIRLSNEGETGAKAVVKNIEDSKEAFMGKARKFEALEGEREEAEMKKIASDKMARRKMKRGKGGQSHKKRQKTR